jgi:hypothetical protein
MVEVLKRHYNSPIAQELLKEVLLAVRNIVTNVVDNKTQFCEAGGVEAVTKLVNHYRSCAMVPEVGATEVGARGCKGSAEQLVEQALATLDYIMFDSCGEQSDDEQSDDEHSPAPDIQDQPPFKRLRASLWSGS